jgi:hypothetical protein
LIAPRLYRIGKETQNFLVIHAVSSPARKILGWSDQTGELRSGKVAFKSARRR